jgi:multidrug efflux pump subunit AcrA (membrane-fusion protein)
VIDHFQAPGTIKAKTQTVLSSKVTGQILSLRVREGDRVRQGDLLVEIEDRDASAQLRRAHAGEAEARQGLNEADGAIPAAEAALHAAEANRDLAMALESVTTCCANGVP